nr:SDR family NAD(P)-dependent oxidoreductase [Donghicola eburneus]
MIDDRACFGDGHSSWVIDLSDPDVIAEAVPRVGTAVGIDILINNAGLGAVALADDQSIDLWDKTHAINLRAPWLMARSGVAVSLGQWCGPDRQHGQSGCSGRLT